MASRSAGPAGPRQEWRPADQTAAEDLGMVTFSACHDVGVTSLSGFPVDAPALTGPVMVDQYWADVTFLHWPVRPADVARFYPAGTRPDVFDGSTYVGLVPFTMRHTNLGRGFALPYFGAFHETNVRLYSVDAA